MVSPCPAPIPCSGQSFYPTPPPSPDLEDVVCLVACPPQSPPTPPLEEELEELLVDTDSLKDPPSVEKPAPELPPLPIALLLNTNLHLPHASSFRLTSPSGILAALGGNRVLSLDLSQSLWDRMPYSAVNAVMPTPNDAEEDQIEALLGGAKEELSLNGLHWALRNHKSHEHLNSFFVHPPTPERIPTPTTENPPVHAKSRLDQHAQASSSSEPPVSASRTPSAGVPKPVSVPLVLSEVRSPPRRTIAMAADSLQLTQKRGRRPRLFGFTELPESSSSSAEGSRQTSPDRPSSLPVQPVHPVQLVEHIATPSSASSSSTIVGTASSSTVNFMPRRAPVRARSEASLQTISSMANATTVPPPIALPRRRDNGLNLDFTGIIPLNSPSDLSASVITSPYSAKLIRKKSGEILKPALKYGGPLASNGTPVVERRDFSPSPTRARFESKSMPSTPSCPKYVHFDAQLERVKLFMHDQKPQVVSRGGSPTADYTTSEGEDGFPFPSTDDEKDERQVLQIKLPNFPTSHPSDTDLFLESLFLDDDRKSLRGIVQCRNFAFHKWVAIRFTFDWWQTTSEVTATHKDSVKGGAFDRFTFLIKLHDILAKIEEKTLFLAIRYNTDGREIWDANNGQNYQVQFEKVAAVPKRPAAARTQPSIQPGMGKAVGGRTSQWSVTGGNAEDRLADLRAKLSLLSAEDLGNSPLQLSPGRDTRTSFNFSPSRQKSNLSGSGSPTGSPRRSLSSFDQRSELPVAGPALAARYDFGTALKTTREGRRNSNSPNSQTRDLPDVRTGLLQYGAKHNGPAMEFNSPRFSPNTPVETLPSNDHFFSPITVSPATIDTTTVPAAIDVPDVTVQGPSPEPIEDPIRVVPPPTTDVGIRRRPSISRSISSPGTMMKVADVSNASPPHLDPSEPGSVTDTPSDSPRSPPDESLPRWSPTSNCEARDESSLASYSTFIEQFCWGGVSSLPPSSGGLEVNKRSHSTSSLDHYFSDHSHHAGIATPRAVPLKSPEKDPGTPSSNASFYTGYSGTPTTRDMDDVEEGLSSHSPEARYGFGVGLAGLSPVAC